MRNIISIESGPQREKYIIVNKRWCGRFK